MVRILLLVGHYIRGKLARLSFEHTLAAPFLVGTFLLAFASGIAEIIRGETVTETVITMVGAGLTLVGTRVFTVKGKTVELSTPLREPAPKE